jgi:uncharacterized protein (DUF2147 family)
MKLPTAAGLGLLLFFSSAAFAAGPEGVWLSQDGGTKVRVSHCGGKLCGTVVWLNSPTDPQTGKPRTDKRNPDPGKRAHPLIGLQVVRDLHPTGPNRWAGVIYNADDGHIYSGRLEVESDNTADLKGCVLKLLCRGERWTRAD